MKTIKQLKTDKDFLVFYMKKKPNVKEVLNLIQKILDNKDERTNFQNNDIYQDNLLKIINYIYIVGDSNELRKNITNFEEISKFITVKDDNEES